MTIPLWVLLGFAGWTLVVLSATVGVYRWFSILTGRTTIGEWHADPPPGGRMVSPGDAGAHELHREFAGVRRHRGLRDRCRSKRQFS